MRQFQGLHVYSIHRCIILPFVREFIPFILLSDIFFLLIFMVLFAISHQYWYNYWVIFWTTHQYRLKSNLNVPLYSDSIPIILSKLCNCFVPFIALHNSYVISDIYRFIDSFTLYYHIHSEYLPYFDSLIFLIPYLIILHNCKSYAFFSNGIYYCSILILDGSIHILDYHDHGFIFGAMLIVYDSSGGGHW